MKNLKTCALVFTFLFASQSYAQTSTSNHVRLNGLVWKADLTAPYKNTQLVVSSKTGLKHILSAVDSLNTQGFLLTQHSLSDEQFIVPESTWTLVSSNYSIKTASGQFKNSQALTKVAFNNKQVSLDPNALSDSNTMDSVSISVDMSKIKQASDQAHLVLSILNRQNV